MRCSSSSGRTAEPFVGRGRKHVQACSSISAGTCISVCNTRVICLRVAKIGCAMVVMHNKLVRNEDDLDELLVFEDDLDARSEY